jgi:hypothetical protein
MHPVEAITIKDYVHLVEVLKTWRAFGSNKYPEEFYEYDGTGMFELFCACIENMRINFNEGKIEDMAETLSPEEREFLTRLLQKQ